MNYVFTLCKHDFHCLRLHEKRTKVLHLMYVTGRVFISHRRSENSPFTEYTEFSGSERAIAYNYFLFRHGAFLQYSPVKLHLSPATRILSENVTNVSKVSTIERIYLLGYRFEKTLFVKRKYYEYNCRMTARIKSRTIAHMNYNDPTYNIAQSLLNR